MNNIIFNELSVSQDFHKINPGIVFSTMHNDYLVYENGVYSIKPKDHIRGLIQEYLISNNVDFKSTFVNSVLNTFRLLQGVSTDDAFEGDPYVINCRNCLLSIRYGNLEVKEHTPSYRTTVQMDVIYDSTKIAPVYEKAIKEILPDKHKREYLLKYMAYCLLYTYEFQKILMLKSDGRSGKGISLKPLQSILGTENYMGLSIDRIATSNWAAAELYGKYLNISSETKMNAINVDMLKTLSGGDMLSSDRKWKGSLSFYNKAKLLILTNLTPKFTETNTAMRERMVTIEFTETFIGANDDTSLSQKITTDDEKSGFLNMLLNMMPTIFTSGSIRFLAPEIINSDTIKMFKELDTVSAYVEDNYELVSTGKILAYKFFNNYTLYCKAHKMVPIPKRHLYTKLRKDLNLPVEKGNGNRLYVMGVAESL